GGKRGVWRGGGGGDGPGDLTGEAQAAGAVEIEAKCLVATPVGRLITEGEKDRGITPLIGDAIIAVGAAGVADERVRDAVLRDVERRGPLPTGVRGFGGTGGQKDD